MNPASRVLFPGQLTCSQRNLWSYWVCINLLYGESSFSLFLNSFFVMPIFMWRFSPFVGNFHCFLLSCEQWGCRQPANAHLLSNRWYRIYTEDGWRSRHRTRSFIIVLSYGDGIMLNIFVDSVAVLAWCDFLQPFRLVFSRWSRSWACEHRILGWSLEVL